MLKPSLPPTEENRLAVLTAYGVLDTLPEKLYDNITLLASQICGTPIALISLVDEKRQWFKSRQGLGAEETPREVSFCGHSILQNDVFQISDSTSDPRFADNPLVTGEPRVIFYAGAPLQTPAGENIGTLCVIDHVPRELTAQQTRSLQALADQVVALLEMRIATHAAQAASQSKSEFLANMSHEIRTPLGAIIGFAGLLTNDNIDTASKRKYAETIIRNGKGLAQIIDDILDLSKIEAGKLEIEVMPFRLSEVIADVTALFEERIETKSIYLRTEVSASVPDHIISDSTRIRQILINLVGNAVKFTNVGGVTVRFDATVREDGSSLLSIHVDDTGIGIEPERRRYLFSPFVQADNTTTRKFGGTGLGLALAKKLANALGGDVTLASSLIGKGSSFAASFICSRVEPKVPMRKPNISETQPTALKDVRILAVDDSLDNLFLVQHFLTKAGAIVETANCGRTAVTQALSSSFDVILLDLQMPDLDGFAAMKLLQAADYDKPVIALTAHAMAEAKAETKRAGFHGHVCKPLDPTELIATIQSLTGR